MNSFPNVQLTQLCHSGGCGCKIAPNLLQDILARITLPSQQSYPHLLIGNVLSDDAAVLDLDGERYHLFTTDFFLPIVDDPQDFGKIAAANALSDIYAMGGTPVAALALVGWPLHHPALQLAPDEHAAVVAAILRGAQEICQRVHVPIAGGHSIDNAEPLFGLAVIGTVPKAHLRTNAGARPGDVLFLTKPLGTGIYGAAIKKGKLDPEDYRTFIDITTTLNVVGAALSALPGVHALTDVTGFGLLGHLLEMCNASNVAAEIIFSQIPRFPNLEYYLHTTGTPGGTQRNWQSYGKHISELTEFQRAILCDPQTSGGLLIAVAPEATQEVQALLHDYQIAATEPIGHLHPPSALPTTIAVS